MKNTFFILVFTLFTGLVEAQDYQISFTGSGLSTAVDSVQVRNLEQNTSLSLLGTDVLHLVQTLGVENPQGLNADIHIYPNPLREVGKIEFNSIRDEDITLEIYDVSGRVIVKEKGQVKPGKNSFEISGFPSGSYIARLSTNTWQESVRFVTVGSNNQKPLIEQKSQTQILPKTAWSNTTNNVVQMQYNTGEILLFTAYGNDHTRVSTLVPTQSQTLDSEFVACQDAAGTHYPVVTIGNQTWMAANLNYATGNSWCYDSDSANCDIYGRLYDWQTALNACPTGWHLPSKAEWEQLANNLGGSFVAGGKMKSTIGWDANYGATNASGFSGLPGGTLSSNGSFSGVGYYAYFWSSTENDIYTNEAWYHYLDYASDNLTSLYNNKNVGRSCRCVED